MIYNLLGSSLWRQRKPFQGVGIILSFLVFHFRRRYLKIIDLASCKFSEIWHRKGTNFVSYPFTNVGDGLFKKLLPFHNIWHLFQLDTQFIISGPVKCRCAFTGCNIMFRVAFKQKFFAWHRVMYIILLFLT